MPKGRALPKQNHHQQFKQSKGWQGYVEYQKLIGDR
jgi:hypothetical protein